MLLPDHARMSDDRVEPAGDDGQRRTSRCGSRHGLLWRRLGRLRCRRHLRGLPRAPVPVERDRSIGRSRHQRVHIVRIVAHAKRSRQPLARRPQRPLFMDGALDVDFVIDVGIDIDVDIITAETGIEAVCFCFG